MKKVVASVGLVAFGVWNLHAAGLGDAASGANKPLNVSATLRGFYDDNVNSLPEGNANLHSTFGFEVSPSVGKAWSLEQSAASFRYDYSLKYYDRKPVNNTDNYDQTHSLNVSLDHAFSPLYLLSVKDSFVIGQEPDQLRTDYALSTFQRISGDNIRNYGVLLFTAQMTRELGFEVGYANSLFDYDDSVYAVQSIFGIPVGVSPSRSGVLDRLEHALHLDATWVLQPETIGRLGYQYRQVNYTADEPIGVTGTFPNTQVIRSDNRDSREHYVYVGATHNFLRSLTGSASVGGRYVSYYKDITGAGSDFGPYATANLDWKYAQDSFVEAGLTHDLNTTDVVGNSGGKITLDEESTVLHVRVDHAILPKLHGSLLAQFQDSTFNGGTFDGKSERDFLLGLSFRYEFNMHFSAEAGYNYDKLESDIPGRAFDRNRVYIGVTATY
jgi:hypothetical protein